MGWQALEQRGDDAIRLDSLTGGVGVNEVWSVRVDGQRAVARLGRRSDADLAGETRLLRHLADAGMAVPVPIPTIDGRLCTDGLVVMTYVEGGPPETEADWRRVADMLRRLHPLTEGWPPRPGWRSSVDILHAEVGAKVELTAMPAETAARGRAAWVRLVGREQRVVHGDPNPGNVRMNADRVALIDWDEAHVDVPDLDLALPTTPPDSTTRHSTSRGGPRQPGRRRSVGTTTTPVTSSPGSAPCDRDPAPERAEPPPRRGFHRVVDTGFEPVASAL